MEAVRGMVRIFSGIAQFRVKKLLEENLQISNLQVKMAIWH